jgi:hypothetical protein
VSVENKQQEVANLIQQRLAAELVVGRSFEDVGLPSDGVLYVRYEGELFAVRVDYVDEEDGA